MDFQHIVPAGEQGPGQSSMSPVDGGAHQRVAAAHAVPIAVAYAVDLEDLQGGSADGSIRGRTLPSQKRLEGLS